MRFSWLRTRSNVNLQRSCWLSESHKNRQRLSAVPVTALFRCCREPSRSAGHMLRCCTQSVATLPSTPPSRFVSAAPDYWKTRSWPSVWSADSWRYGGWEFEKQKQGNERKWSDSAYTLRVEEPTDGGSIPVNVEERFWAYLSVPSQCKWQWSCQMCFCSARYPAGSGAHASSYSLGTEGVKRPGSRSLPSLKNTWSSTSTPSLIILALNGQQRSAKILQSNEWRV
jgi:hypothetical protein